MGAGTKQRYEHEELEWQPGLFQKCCGFRCLGAPCSLVSTCFATPCLVLCMLLLAFTIYQPQVYEVKSEYTYSSSEHTKTITIGLDSQAKICYDKTVSALSIADGCKTKSLSDAGFGSNYKDMIFRHQIYLYVALGCLLICLIVDLCACCATGALCTLPHPNPCFKGFLVCHKGCTWLFMFLAFAMLACASVEFNWKNNEYYCDGSGVGVCDGDILGEWTGSKDLGSELVLTKETFTPLVGDYYVGMEAGYVRYHLAALILFVMAKCECCSVIFLCCGACASICADRRRSKRKSSKKRDRRTSSTRKANSKQKQKEIDDFYGDIYGETYV